MRNKFAEVALRTSVIYAIIAAAWILLSDQMVTVLIHDQTMQYEISVVKGWIFVIVTAGLLYVTLRRQLRRIEREMKARMEVEKQLRLQATALESAANAIIITDRNAVVEWANPAFYKLSGYSPKETIGQHTRALLKSGKQSAEFYKELWDTILNRKIWRGELINRRKDNTLYPEELTITPVSDENGKITNYVAIKLDITERKKIAEALRKSEEHLRNAARIGGVGSFEHNHLTNEIYFSPLVRGFYQLNETEAATIPKILESVVPEDRDLLANTIQRAHDPKGNGKFGIEYRLRLKDGGIRWVRAMSQTTFEGEGEARHPVRTVGAIVDVTERNESEAAMRKVNRALQMVSACNQELIRATDETQLLNKICALIVSMGGYSTTWVGFAQDDQEKSVRIAAHAGENSDTATRIKLSWGDNPHGHGPTGTAIRTGQPCLIQDIDADPRTLVWKAQFTHTKPATIFALPMTVNDRTIGALTVGCPASNTFDKEEVALLTELTDDLAFGIGVLRGHVAHSRTEEERQKLESQFRQVQKMEAIGQLAGGVAHDFNNILTVIQGNASMLTMDNPRSEDSAECAQQIVAAAERAAGLTRQLLMFSRKQVMQPANRDLNDVIAQMTRMLQRILGEDVTLHSISTPNLPLIYADTGMIEQVLLNLAVNSRDAMPGGGKLTIMTGKESLTEEQAHENPDATPGLCVCLTVSDTGEGIPPEILPRIFEPFFTTKEVGKGTGLGLATVYGIVKQHRGWITVTSELKHGTTFRIYFPATTEGKAEAKNAAHVAELPRGSETILVVEDEPSVRMLVCSMLQHCGYTILQAPTGRTALAEWQENRGRIQLLLTDIIMPDGMTGVELAKELQQEKPQLKVVFTSGYSGEAAGKGLQLVEGVNFLKKPYLPEELAKILRRNLDGSAR